MYLSVFHAEEYNDVNDDDEDDYDDSDNDDDDDDVVEKVEYDVGDKNIDIDDLWHYIYSACFYPDIVIKCFHVIF